MTEAVESIGKKDIEKFIIQHKYDENRLDWPRGQGATIVLSTVKIYYTKRSSTSIRNCKLTIKALYKNGEHPNHAERYFRNDLKEEIDTLLKDKETKVTKIRAKLVQNYSPCKNCADMILKFKDGRENQGINISLTIKFANFYRHNFESTREGLRGLLRNDVKLELLHGEDDWKEFLNDETFVNLTVRKNKQLLERATSKERKEREEDDVKILNEIKLEASGKQKATEQYSYTVKLVFL